MPAYKCINPDDFLQTPSGRLWTPERNKTAWALAHASFKQALSKRAQGDAPNRRPDVYVVCGIQGAGKSTWISDNATRLAPCVFFDAALPRVVHRQPLIRMAQEVGATVHAVWINTPLTEALNRNAMRKTDEQVPAASIIAVAEQFEAPTVTEGFATVLEVNGGRVAL